MVCVAVAAVWVKIETILTSPAQKKTHNLSKGQGGGISPEGAAPVSAGRAVWALATPSAQGALLP